MHQTFYCLDIARARLSHNKTLRWRHNGCDGVSNQRPHDCLLNVYSAADQSKHHSSASLVFVRGILPGAGEFPAQMASHAENVSLRWRHHDVSHVRGCLVTVLGKARAINYMATQPSSIIYFVFIITAFANVCTSSLWIMFHRNATDVTQTLKTLAKLLQVI